MRKKNRRKRIIRTFDFGRILAFSAVVCIAVAALAVLMSFKQGEKYTVGKPCTFYAVTFGDSDDYRTAREDAAKCAARGGGGYIYSDGERFFVIAAIYADGTDARAVSANIDGSKVLSFDLPQIRMERSESMSAAADFYLSVPEELARCAEEIDKGETSEAVCIKRLSLYRAEAQRLSAELSASAKEGRQAEELSKLLKRTCSSMETAFDSGDKATSVFRRLAAEAALDSFTVFTEFFSNNG